MVHYDQYEESSNYAGNVYAGISIDMQSHTNNNWAHIAETTMPLATSKYANVNRGQFLASIQHRAKEISSKVITVNLISSIVNLLLASVAFYFAFVNDSPSTTAFAADCILDFFSSAIVLWRYYGDLNSIYMQAREQIACIYLGALFEVSALAIVIKALSDITSDPTLDGEVSTSYELVYLALVASFICSATMAVKCSLYKTLRDNSILLDVVNGLISTVFALSIVMSQLLINVNPTFWYLDPILSIVLALFMALYGYKVIRDNFLILRPPTYETYHNNLNSFNGLSLQNELPNLQFDIGKKKDLISNNNVNYGTKN